jgi:hypothetical protein
VEQNVRMAWHYTTGTRAAEILRAGVLAPSALDDHSGLTPVVWFSLRQHWEPIANERFKASDGTLSRLSFEDTVARGQGAWRFGLPAVQLLPWRELQKSAQLSKDDARALERTGRKAGSDPALWLGSLEAIDVSRCVVEHLHGEHWHGSDHEH